MTHPSAFIVGAAQTDITPQRSMFLFGYPHVERMSTGVHDPLLASAMYVSDGDAAALFVGTDLIWTPREVAKRARERIEAATGVPAAQVMLTASHTHSGPVVSSMLSNESDPVVPRPDAAYLAQVEDGLVAAAEQAYKAAQPARLSEAVADGTGLGTNRRDPQGPAVPRVPVLVARSLEGDKLIGVMAVCNMHPTVLHEDSTVVSGDFPGLARLWLQQHTLGSDCPFVYHMGVSGNQSPRHVVRGQTMEEAERLGRILGEAVTKAMGEATPIDRIEVACDRRIVELPVRQFPPLAVAQAAVDRTKARLAELQQTVGNSPVTRTAETDVFGAEETLTLARAAAEGKVDKAAAACMPAEIQCFRIGEFNWVGWPGEVFVEFGLEVMERHPRTAIITLANGDLEGYLVTAQAVEEAGYEASNALFQSPDSGRCFVETTLELLTGQAATQGVSG